MKISLLKMLLYSVLAAAAVPLAGGEYSHRSLAALGDDSTQTEYSYDYTDAPTASPTFTDAPTTTAAPTRTETRAGSAAVSEPSASACA